MAAQKGVLFLRGRQLSMCKFRPFFMREGGAFLWAKGLRNET
jgi:hypothetical protein